MKLCVRDSWFDPVTPDVLLHDHNSEADTLAHLHALDKKLSEWQQKAQLPNCWYLTSAAEVNVLLDPILQQWLAKKAQQGFRLEFLGSACTSWHAAILEFSQSSLQDVLVLQLELNKDRQQDCLDCLGIGIQPEQDGLDAVTGVALSWLSKTPTAGDQAHILDCDLLSQPASLVGMPRLIHMVRKRLNSSPNANVVSFDIHSRWGKQLFRGFGDHSKSWLASLELCGHHFLSIKPVREMHRYLLQQQRNEVWLLTLGGGGRIGCLRLGQPDTSADEFVVRPVHREVLTMETSLRQFQSALQVKQHSSAAFYPMVRSAMTYPQKHFRGHHNQVFYWQSDSQWSSLSKHYGVQYGEA